MLSGGEQSSETLFALDDFSQRRYELMLNGLKGYARTTDNPLDRSFAEAAAVEITYNPAWRNLVYDFTNQRQLLIPGVEPDETRGYIYLNEAINLLRSSIQFDVLEYDVNYPRGYESAVSWFKLFDSIAADQEKFRLSQILVRLLDDNLHTCIESRAVPVDLLTQLTKVKEYPALSVGASTQEMDRQLVLKDQIPMEPVTLYDPKDAQSQHWQHIDDNLTFAARALQHRPPKIPHITGIDRDEMHKPQLRLRALADKRPSELGSIQRTRRATQLLETPTDQVDFIQADFLDTADMARVRAKLKGRYFGIVILSTVLYQQRSKLKRESMLKTAENYVDPEQEWLIVIQDHVRAVRGRELVPLSSWGRAGNYRLYFKQKDGPKGYQEGFRAHDSRGLDLIAGTGKIVIAREQVPIREALLTS